MPTRRTFLSSLAALIPAWLVPTWAKASSDAQSPDCLPVSGMTSARAAQFLRDNNPSRTCPFFKAEFGDGPHISDYPELKAATAGLDSYDDEMCLSTNDKSEMAFARLGILPTRVDVSVLRLIQIARCISFSRDGNHGDPLTADDIAYACGDRWIPVTERLPEVNKTRQSIFANLDPCFQSDPILVTDGKKVWSSWIRTRPDSRYWYPGSNWLIVGDSERSPVTHWRPMPAPPTP